MNKSVLAATESLSAAIGAAASGLAGFAARVPPDGTLSLVKHGHNGSKVAAYDEVECVGKLTKQCPLDRLGHTWKLPRVLRHAIEDVL